MGNINLLQLTCQPNSVRLISPILNHICSSRGIVVCKFHNVNSIAHAHWLILLIAYRQRGNVPIIGGCCCKRHGSAWILTPTPSHTVPQPRWCMCTPCKHRVDHRWGLTMYIRTYAQSRNWHAGASWPTPRSEAWPQTIPSADLDMPPLDIIQSQRRRFPDLKPSHTEPEWDSGSRRTVEPVPLAKLRQTCAAQSRIGSIPLR